MNKFLVFTLLVSCLGFSTGCSRKCCNGVPFPPISSYSCNESVTPPCCCVEAEQGEYRCMSQSHANRNGMSCVSASYCKGKQGICGGKR